MTKAMFRMCAMIAMVLAGSQTTLRAQGPHTLEGTWHVAVTVRDCKTGAIIRTVRSLQMFSRDRSFTETADTFLRGSSVGAWAHAGGDIHTATYWFFRYNPDGTFKSIAEALDKISLSDDSHFTASGAITDYDANGNPISVGCFTHAATRLSYPK